MILCCENMGLETLKRYNLDIIEHYILKIIWSYENKKKDCFLSLDKIANYLNIGERTADRKIKSLKSKGFIYCDKQEKKLSSLGGLYCRTVFNYRPYKPKKKAAPLPSWYNDYKIEVASNNKVYVEEENKSIEELKRQAKKLFS